MSKIFIYGVPGVGKTYYSKILAKNQKLFVVEGDSLRKELQKKVSKGENPFLYSSTCKAFKFFGPLNEENSVKGLLEVRNSLVDYEVEFAKNNDNFILEAAFLDPMALKSFGKLILLTCIDRVVHRKQFMTHREKIFDFKGEEFKAAELIQKYLIKEAKELRIEIIDASEIKSRVA